MGDPNDRVLYNKERIEAIEASIAKEISDRIAAVNAATAKLNTEIADRKAAITDATNKLNTEIAERKTAITNLETYVANAKTSLASVLNTYFKYTLTAASTFADISNTIINIKSTAGNASAGHVLQSTGAGNTGTGITFLSSNVDRGTQGTMPNNGALSKTIAPGDTCTGGAGYYSSITVKADGATLTGNAEAGHVLAGYTFYNTDYKTQITGTMTNNGAVSKSVGTDGTYTGTAGYYSSLKISATDYGTGRYNDGYEKGYTAGYNAGYAAAGNGSIKIALECYDYDDINGALHLKSTSIALNQFKKIYKYVYIETVAYTYVEGKYRDNGTTKLTTREGGGLHKRFTLSSMPETSCRLRCWRKNDGSTWETEGTGSLEFSNDSNLYAQTTS